MNILPLVMALVLMLSVLTIEKLEKFKNQTAVQRQYQIFLEKGEGQLFNQRQKALFGIHPKSHRQLSFRGFLDKKFRERDSDATKQYRLLNIELMKILYGEAAFFKELKEKRGEEFLEEMLTAIEQAADAAPKKMIRRIQDIARLELEDPELQKAFYLMLKGTILRGELEDQKEINAEMKEKAYPSLLTFINYNGKKRTPKIEIQLAPREILKALFVEDEIVEEILAKRNKLAEKKDNGAETEFKNQFIGKVRNNISDKLLDFKISSTDKTEHN